MRKLAALFGLIVLAAPALSADARSGGEFFRDEVAPILSRHCYECHDGAKQKSGLRLDRREEAMRGGDSGKALLVAGKPEESLIFQKVTAASADDVMPPKGERLNAEEIAVLKKWILEGGVWPAGDSSSEKTHWAYIKPVKPSLPALNSGWVKNAVDSFILARLEKEGLKPSPEAPREVLIRRLALDLTGLPPTTEELDRFTKNNSEQLWEEAVDFYLASPHYGEQRARVWLDLARYADSHGYEKDPGREIWLYRDWVINAFNRNLPFDEFTIEQIAGDLLPNCTESQKIASGFHRNTMFNTEGGVDREEARMETIVDRVNTTATVWLGSTLACAQCHTHKYDPFTLKEYYQFLAFFNNCDEPDLEVPSAAQAEKRKSLREDIARFEKMINTQTTELNNAQAAWEYRVAEQTPKFEILEPAGAISAGGAMLETLEDRSIRAAGLNPENDSYTVVAHTGARKITGLRLEVFPDDSLPHKSLGRHSNGSFVLTHFEVKAAPKSNPKAARIVKFKRAAADYTQNGHSAMNLIEDKPGNGWAASAGEEKLRVQRYVLFEAEDPVDFENGATLTITLRNDSQWPEANVGRFRLAVTTSPEPVPSELLSLRILKLLAVAPMERSTAQRDELAKYYRSIAPELKEAREQLATNRKLLDQLQKSIPKTMVMKERLENPRETHIHLRGNFLNKGDRVFPGVPAVLNPVEGTNRLALAKWLVSPENPLTARVTVNRFWARLFGTGLVETEEDFGTQGDRPTHPELLDYLAVEFMESGWDMKALHKTLVMSRTYRQSSKTTEELLERDPANRLLARGPRFRVNAESVRDIALAASGLLQDHIGGPSVYPSQPDGIWTQIYGSEKWETSKGENRYRRGLYTYWKRTSPYPAFMSFDAPSREYCTARRPRTNTPLQALTTLNDPAYIEAARALAQKIMECGESNIEGCIDFAFRRVLSRLPRSEERTRLAKLFESELANYSGNGDAAVKMAFGTAAKPPGDVDPVRAAAWTVVANVLLNLDETITKS